MTTALGGQRSCYATACKNPALTITRNFGTQSGKIAGFNKYGKQKKHQQKHNASTVVTDRLTISTDDGTLVIDVVHTGLADNTCVDGINGSIKLSQRRPVSVQVNTSNTATPAQWRNYERRSEAIASGRQAAGGAFGRRIVCFALQNSAEFLKRERS